MEAYDGFYLRVIYNVLCFGVVFSLFVVKKWRLRLSLMLFFKFEFEVEVYYHFTSFTSFKKCCCIHYFLDGDLSIPYEWRFL